MVAREICPNVLYVGTQDWDRKLFDNLVPLPDGTSYNSYLVKGIEKTALVDTTYPPKIEEYMLNLKKAAGDRIDYIVSNHSEQDHTGAIPKILEIYPEANIVTNQKCKELTQDALLIPDDKFIIINDGETLSLGDKTLEFIFAPWVHWPDTMFTYLKEDKILFSCDFLGAHLATSDLHVTNECQVYAAAKRYYAEIMMPFRANIQKHLDKIDTMEVKKIAASHGPIYQNPKFILDAYKDWSSNEVKNQVVIPYVTMYESTEKMVNYLANSLIEKGISVKPINLIEADVGELAMELVDAATLVIGAPTVLAGAHPAAASAVYLVNALRPKFKFASFIGSLGWGGVMVNQLKGMMPNLKVEFIDPVLTKGLPKEQDYKLLDELADKIKEKHESLGI